MSWGVNAIDHSGTPLYLAPSDLGHGDRFGKGDFDPDQAGLEGFTIQQKATSTDIVPLAVLFNAKTRDKDKNIQWSKPRCQPR